MWETGFQIVPMTNLCLVYMESQLQNNTFFNCDPLVSLPLFSDGITSYKLLIVGSLSSFLRQHLYLKTSAILRLKLCMETQIPGIYWGQ